MTVSLPYNASLIEFPISASLFLIDQAEFPRFEDPHDHLRWLRLIAM